MTTWYDYMVRASEHAGSDGDLWFRYLYKVIQDEETKLTNDDYGINEPNELWLNNNVANLNRIPPRSICEKVFSYSHLTILVPPLLYILGMKLESGRDRNRQDAGDIIRLVKIRSIEDVTNKFKAYGLQPDLSLILKAFEIAYGMEWLSEYLTEHPEELR